MVAVFRAFPLSVRAAVKEVMGSRAQTVGRLDYAGADIWIHVDSTIEYRTRLRSCEKEPETVTWIEQQVRPGDVVFDIGANVGVYSFVINKSSRGLATVYAFEPSAQNFVQLSRNITLNGCSDRVIPLHVALGAMSGLNTLSYSSTTPGTALHTVGSAVDGHGRPFVPALREPVVTFRLDDVEAALGVPKPTHMKLDVDGTELQILSGGSRLLADRSLRSVLVEIEPESPSAEQIVALLISAGFVIHSRRRHGRPGEVANYLFVRSAENSKRADP